MQEVRVPAFSLDRFLPYIGDARFDQFTDVATRARRVLGNRVVWNVNSTASGGGVSEMLHVLLAYARGAGFDVRWMVIDGTAEFFATTKRLHHLLHGHDPGYTSSDHDHRVYREVAQRNAEELRGLLHPGDVVVAHDPQTAGLIAELADEGLILVWRCHVGADVENDATRSAWEFLAPYVAPAHGYVFSRAAYAPATLDPQRVTIVPPSIDPFSAKNQDLDAETVAAIVARIGLVSSESDMVPRFVRQDGSPGRVDRSARIEREGGPIPSDAPLVVQVSRWDPLKDMPGVMRAFAEHVEDHDEAYLALVGPDVTGVADDPEGEQVLTACVSAWRDLPRDLRRRVQLVTLPMDDLEENAAMVNAIQRHAAIVVQKSLAEGFGLTVTEAMWKTRPVLASAVGGIRDQIESGVHGLLVEDPQDLASVGSGLSWLLDHPDEARRLGERARARVTEHFLIDRHLEQCVQLMATLAS